MSYLGQKEKRGKIQKNGLFYISVIKIQFSLHQNVTEIQKFIIRNFFQSHFTLTAFELVFEVSGLRTLVYFDKQRILVTSIHC